VLYQHLEVGCDIAKAIRFITIDLSHTHFFSHVHPLPFIKYDIHLIFSKEAMG
jgi:hypothetical protein